MRTNVGQDLTLRSFEFTLPFVSPGQPLAAADVTRVHLQGSFRLLKRIVVPFHLQVLVGEVISDSHVQGIQFEGFPGLCYCRLVPSDSQ